MKLCTPRLMRSTQAVFRKASFSAVTVPGDISNETGSHSSELARRR